MKFRVFLTATLLLMLCLLLAGCGNKYTVTFDTGGGTEIVAQKVTKGDRVQKPQDPERAGYTFVGWTYSGEEWSFIQHTVTGNMTLTAKWSPVAYTITYDDASTNSNPTSFTVESADIILTTPTRAGYAFTGWTWEGQPEPQMTVIIPTGTHENKAFSAHWKFDGFVCSETGELTLTEEAKSCVPADLVIPAVVNGVAVTSIGQSAFYGCAGLTSITIPDSVTSIGSWAFFGCTKLTYNTYDNAQYLGNAQNPYMVLIKANNVSITSCTIHADTKVIYFSAFADCVHLTSITIPDSVASIGLEAFRNCTNLTSITINAGNTVYHSAGNCIVETASKTLIAGCKTSVIPTGGSVTSIGYGAFYYCVNLTNITIPDSVTSIGDRAFYGCASMTSIIIPNGVTSIGYEAFYDCRNMTSIIIPDSVTSVGSDVFYGCTKLNYNTYNNAAYLGNAQNPYVVLRSTNDTSITSCTIHADTKAIYYSAFFSCTRLINITIPDSVTDIGQYAFWNCTSLTNITYQGTKAQWDTISKGFHWNDSTGNYTVHCTDGDIVKS